VRVVVHPLKNAKRARTAGAGEWPRVAFTDMEVTPEYAVAG
jgi:hypothetical protein